MSTDQCRPWGELPHDICIQFLEMLFGKDIASFRLVCKHWRHTPTPQVKRISHHHPISEIVKHPLLLSFRPKVASSSASYGRLYSPAYNKTYLVDTIPGIAHAQIHCYDYGWLLMSHDKCVLFFFHPTTQSIIELPRFDLLDKWTFFNRISFSAPPTSPDCMVFGLVSDKFTRTDVLISIIRRGEDQWTKYPREQTLSRTLISNNKKEKNKLSHHHRHPPIPYKLNAPFNTSNFSTPPVFHNGEFYSLGVGGRLGIFNPDKNIKWRVLNTAHASFPADVLCETYLTKSTNGQLISVIVGSKGESNSVRVLRFNEILEKWDNVTYLKGEVIFLSRSSCMVISCQELGVKGLENTIHFPRFDGDGHNIFYSISSKKFHTFEGVAKDDLCDTMLPVNCAWIVPHDFQSFNEQQLNWSQLVIEPTGIEKQGDHYMSTLEKQTFLQPIDEASRCQKTIIDRQDTSSPRKPWIIFPHQIQDKQLSIAYVDLTSETDYYSSQTTSIDRRVFLMSDERLKEKTVMGSKDGRVFLMDVTQGICMLVDTTSMTIHQLPMLKNLPKFERKCCLLHNFSPDQHSKVSIIIFGTVWGEDDEADDYFVFFCTIGDDRWTTLEGKFDIAAVVSFDGKIYGIADDYHPELVEIKLQPNDTPPTRLFYFPFYRESRTGCRKTIDKFVESCGELLYFHIDFYGFVGGEDLIANVKVYKIDVKKEESAEKFKELEDFGDRAFFFSQNLDYGFGCCASKSRLKANTIYYICASSNKLYKYDYGNASVSFSVYCPRIKESLYKNKFIMCC